MGFGAHGFAFGGRERKIPGSFHLEAVEDVAEVGVDIDGLMDEEEMWLEMDPEWEGVEEDDFGVPLRSPIRLKGRTEGVERREMRRRGWDVD